MLSKRDGNDDYSGTRQPFLKVWTKLLVCHVSTDLKSLINTRKFGLTT